jgi:hypothetical protein
VISFGCRYKEIIFLGRLLQYEISAVEDHVNAIGQLSFRERKLVPLYLEPWSTLRNSASGTGAFKDHRLGS